ncbi:MAG: transglutaminase-like domain-containing protein [Candidatus Lokiarchaeota archaeon]
MKFQKLYIIIVLLLFTIIIIYPFSTLSVVNEKNPKNSKIAGYNLKQGILIRFEGNYTLIHKELIPRNYYFKLSDIDTCSPHSLYTPNTPPYQEINITENKIIGNDTTIHHTIDKFNNSYNLFNTTLNLNEKVMIVQNYTIKLNAISFDQINNSNIGEYEPKNEIFALFCNKTEKYFEIDNLGLINASNNIVGSSTNPIEKAKKIYNWIGKNINYDGSLSEEKGALWAFLNKKGDCSEFSDLMITLLRIQGIPARKITGIVLSSNSNFQPYVGQKITFTANKETQDFLGHAWIEYYVPNIGWIACDPTWNQPNGAYFNNIDFYHIGFNVGAWFSYPGLSSELSEFPYIPSPATSIYSDYSFDYNVTITILKTNFTNFDIFPIFILVVIICSVIILLIIIITIIIRSRKRLSKRKYYC